MSFVTTPSSSSPPSERQSAATSELLPDPTGPPIPIRSARSGGKELPLPCGVGEGEQLERRREAGRQEAPVARCAGGVAGEAVDQRRGVEEPARGQRRVDREQPYGRRGHRRRVL